MRLLAIECTHQIACVAVKNGNIVVERIGQNWQKTAETIVPMVVQAMAEAGLCADELDAVAVSSGPGSFTALRIGMSAAKGIAWGTGRPLLPVPTLQAMASATASRVGPALIAPVIPSRPGEFFYGVYRVREHAGMPEELDCSRCSAAELPVRLAIHGERLVIPARDPSAVLSQLSDLSRQVLEASFFTAASLFDQAVSTLAAAPVPLVSDVVPDYRQQFVPGYKKQ